MVCCQFQSGMKPPAPPLNSQTVAVFQWQEGTARAPPYDHTNVHVCRTLRTVCYVCLGVCGHLCVGVCMHAWFTELVVHSKP